MNTQETWKWIGAAALVMIMIAGSAVGETFIMDGAGFWWDFAEDGGVVDGRGPSGSPDSIDAFDHAARLMVNGVRFPDTTQSLTLGDRMIVSGPEVMSGLVITRRAYVPAATGANWCCFLEYFENPSENTIAVNIRIVGNLGSDGGTQVTASSSGDLVWTPEDRWIASSDGMNGNEDPTLSFNYWGTGAAISPVAVFLPASQEDYYCDFETLSVPAGETVVLMHFLSQNRSDAAAQATAVYLDALPPETLAGLDAAYYGPVVNWSISSALAVTPESIRVSAGQQGGPFAPASHVYTLTGSESISIDWSASGPAWVDIVPNSGTLPISGSTQVTVSFNGTANTLPPGANVDMITFTNITDGNTTLRALRVDVGERLEVAEADGYEASGFLGGPFTPASRSYTLTNTGNTALQWSVSAPPWIQVSPANHTADGGELAPTAATIITVSPSPAAAALPPGNYADVLVIHNDSYGSTQERAVALETRQQLQVVCAEAGSPAIARGVVGGPFAPELSFRIANIAMDTAINWQINPASLPAWLNLSDTSGALSAGDAAHTTGIFTTAAQALAPGDYNATLEFVNTTHPSTVSYDVILRVKQTVYVDAAASPGGDGSSWATALNTIQAGIDLAATGDYWVWVAKGIYHERITMAQGVEVHGGFTSGAASFAERDVLDNGTIIDGGAAGRVATFDAIGLAGISGCTLQNGNADANGGGGVRMFGSANTCFIDHCIIRQNSALARGAGIYCLNGAAPRLSYNHIINNVQNAENRDFGGGIACYQANPTIYRCMLVNNVGRYGGGIGCIQSSPRIEGCVVTGNMAAFDVINPGSGHPQGSGGGGIFAHDNASPAIVNTIIAGNVSRNWGAGALYCQGSSRPVLTNCTVSRNYSFHTNGSLQWSGFVANSNSRITLRNTVVEGMGSIAAYEENPRGDVLNDTSDIIPEYCLFTGNAGGDLRDYDTLAVYTGGDALNAFVNGAHNNVAGAPDPQYKTVLTGTWTAAPVYDAVSQTTTLTASGDPFQGIDLSGLSLNADTAQWRQTVIAENTNNTITVWGDITAATGIYGYTDANDSYAIFDYRIAGISPCANVGLRNPDLTPYDDLDYAVRGADVCIGAFENNAPTVAEILSITSDQDAVSNATVITFDIVFSRAVFGLTADDFLLLMGGNHTGAMIINVSGSGCHWTVTVATGAGNGAISLVFSDPDGSVTDIIGLNNVPEYGNDEDVYMDFLEITEHPQDAALLVGDSHVLWVNAINGTGTLSYIWYKDGSNLNAPDSNELTLTNLTESDSGYYHCVVSDEYTTVISNQARLDVNVRVPASAAAALIMVSGMLMLIGARRLQQQRK